jgi:hypothetical protein
MLHPWSLTLSVGRTIQARTPVTAISLGGLLGAQVGGQRRATAARTANGFAIVDLEFEVGEDLLVVSTESAAYMPVTQ